MKSDGVPPLLARLSAFTDVPPADDSEAMHGLHPYPAKYIPQLPRLVLEEHTNERNRVLDPFCGSGTTLLEAAILGRKATGIDSNPVATLVSRAKTHALDRSSLGLARALAAEARSVDPSGVSGPVDDLIGRPISHWFQDNMVRELAWLRSRCDVQDARLRDFLRSVFSSIVVAVSNQDSDTRYAAVAKARPDGYALGRFARRLEAATAWAAELGSNRRYRRNPPLIYTSDATALSALVEPGTIDLIVTSPPYPNSYDYYLYHKLRMWWLGLDHAPVRDTEIGSRYEHSSRRAPLDVFRHRVAPILRGMACVLKPSKFAYLFVGDSVIAGKHIDMGTFYAELGAESGFRVVDAIAYSLNDVSRSFRDTRHVAGKGRRHTKLQHVVVLEARGGRARKSNRPIAQPVPRRAATDLGSVPDGAVIALRSDEQDRHVHALTSYPAKFIPEIPRWAIEAYSAPGEVVLDPFAGSGTTAVESLILGRPAVSADISPFAALSARAKTTRVAEDDLRSSARVLEQACASPSTLPSASGLSFPLDDFWFPAGHLDEFARLLRFVDEEMPSGLADFYRLVAASTIRPFSYQDPGQIKVKRDPRKVLRGTAPPAELLRARLPGAVDRLLRFNELARSDVLHTALAQSADQALMNRGQASADLIVTSPPYINAMNYAMTQRYELVLLGLVSHDDLNAHQTQYFGSERVYARDYARLHQFDSGHPLARPLNGSLARIFEAEPKRAFIVYQFFSQMDRTAREMMRVLRPGGRVVLVAGTNVIRGEPIDTFGLLASLLAAHGGERELTFHYEIVKQALKLRRHATAKVIPHDGVAVVRKEAT